MRFFVRPCRLLLAPLLLSPLILAGCDTIKPNPPPLPAPRSQQEADCQRKAQDDPTVYDYRMRQLANAYSEEYYRQDYNAALRAATNRCLAALGLPLPGGVEPIKQPR